MSCSAIYNDYDGIQHDYTRKQGLVWEHVYLPDCAPAEWKDRAKLWNAVEETEKTKDSRLAREFVVALPIELGRQDWIDLLSKAEAAEAKYNAELDKALAEYHDLEARAEELDPEELQAARLSLRPEEEKRAVSKLEDAYGTRYDPSAMLDAKNKVSDLLGEERSGTAPRSLRENLRQKQKSAQQRELPQRKKSRDQER